MYLLYGYIFLIVIFTLTWLLYLKTKNPSIVDTVWSLGIASTGLIFLSQNINTRTLLIACLLIVWSIRLGGYIWYTRVRIHQVDKRYLSLSSNWKSMTIGFLLNYQLQAILAWLCALPLFFSTTSDFTVIDILATLLVCTGIVGEDFIKLIQQESRDMERVVVQKMGSDVSYY